MLAKDLSFENHQLHYRLGQQEKVLLLVNEKLILQPGTQIFLEKIQFVSFEEFEKKIYLVYRSNYGERKVGIYVP